jgi:hypothetical protein
VKFSKMHIFLCACKHQVGAAIIANHVDYHDREFAIVRSRGRPKKSKGALTK